MWRTGGTCGSSVRRRCCVPCGLDWFICISTTWYSGSYQYSNRLTCQRRPKANYALVASASRRSYGTDTCLHQHHYSRYVSNLVSCYRFGGYHRSDDSHRWFNASIWPTTLFIIQAINRETMLLGVRRPQGRSQMTSPRSLKLDPLIIWIVTSTRMLAGNACFGDRSSWYS